LTRLEFGNWYRYRDSRLWFLHSHMMLLRGGDGQLLGKSFEFSLNVFGKVKYVLKIQFFKKFNGINKDRMARIYTTDCLQNHTYFNFSRNVKYCSVLYLTFVLDTLYTVQWTQMQVVLYTLWGVCPKQKQTNIKTNNDKLTKGWCKLGSTMIVLMY
jgi:hypothetical protein